MATTDPFADLIPEDPFADLVRKPVTVANTRPEDPFADLIAAPTATSPAFTAEEQGLLREFETFRAQQEDPFADLVPTKKEPPFARPPAFERPLEESSWKEILSSKLETVPATFKKQAGAALVRIGKQDEVLAHALIRAAEDLPDKEDVSISATVKRLMTAMRLAPSFAGALPQLIAKQASPDLNKTVKQAHQELEDLGQDIYRKAEKDIKENYPDLERGSVKYYLSQVVDATANMVPAITATVLAKSPTTGAAIMGTQVYADKFQEALDKERNADEAAQDAFFSALFEAIPERVALGVLTKEGGRFLTNVLKGSAAEGVQEALTESLQIGYDTGVLDEEMTWGEAAERIKDAAIVGALTGGAVRTAVEPFVRGVKQDAVETRDITGRDREEYRGAGEVRPTDEPVDSDRIREGEGVRSEDTEAQEKADARIVEARKRVQKPKEPELEPREFVAGEQVTTIDGESRRIISVQDGTATVRNVRGVDEEVSVKTLTPVLKAGDYVTDFKDNSYEIVEVFEDSLRVRNAYGTEIELPKANTTPMQVKTPVKEVEKYRPQITKTAPMEMDIGSLVKDAQGQEHTVVGFGQEDEVIIRDKSGVDVTVFEESLTVEPFVPGQKVVNKRGTEFTVLDTTDQKTIQVENAQGTEITLQREGMVPIAKIKKPAVVEKPVEVQAPVEKPARARTITPEESVSEQKKIAPALPAEAIPAKKVSPKKVDLSKKHEFDLPPEKKARIREMQKGLKDQRTLIQKAKDFVERTRIGFTRKYEYIPNTPEFAPALETFREYSEAPDAASDTAIRFLKGTTDKLNNRQFDDFTLKVQFDDFMYEVESDRQLTAGLTPDEVRAEHAAISARVDADPVVRAAVEKRNQFIQTVGNQAVKAGILTKKQLQNPSYFRHQVLEYAREQDHVQQRRRNLRIPKPGAAKGRKGTIKDINLNYLEAEYEYLQRMLTDITKAKSIKKLDRRYGIKADVQQTAREANGAAFLKTNPGTADTLEFEEMRISGVTLKMDRFLEEKLGGKYRPYTDFTPATHEEIEISNGKIYFSAMSVAERQIDVIDDMVVDKLREAGADPKVIALLDKTIKEQKAAIDVTTTIIIPTELAQTFKDMPTHADRRGIAKAIAASTSGWKVWTLLSPHNVIQYNINNFFSDLDAVVAGHPAALKKLGPAISELHRVMKGGDPSKMYLEAQRSGVFASGFSIQELPEINELSYFAKRTGGDIKSWPKRKVWQYWRAVKDYTRFRENWFRYAVYLSQRERLAQGKPIQYGASVPKMVDASPTNAEKAALLTRDMVGDYGNLSKYGVEIRETAIPFYSWMEVNLKRYTRLHVNVARQIINGIKTGEISEAAAGSVMATYLLARMWAVYAIGSLWNNMMFPDEEDDLPHEDKIRPHLTLGRGDDGEVVLLRFQGALSDYYGWWGFMDAASAVNEVMAGKGTVEEVAQVAGKAAANRVVSGLTPSLKVPLELAAGKSFWPDVFNPRVIPDPMRHIAGAFSVANEYDWLTGKPTKGVGPVLWAALDPLTYKDPEAVAYNDIRNKAFDFKEDATGTEWQRSFTTPKQNLVRLYKLSKKLGDKDAEKRLLKEMQEQGVTFEERQKILQRMHPLNMLTLSERSQFLRTLSNSEREKLSKAVKYYNETYR